MIYYCVDEYVVMSCMVCRQQQIHAQQVPHGALPMGPHPGGLIGFPNPPPPHALLKPADIHPQAEPHKPPTDDRLVSIFVYYYNQFYYFRIGAGFLVELLVVRCEK